MTAEHEDTRLWKSFLRDAVAEIEAAGGTVVIDGAFAGEVSEYVRFTVDGTDRFWAVLRGGGGNPEINIDRETVVPVPGAFAGGIKDAGAWLAGVTAARWDGGGVE